MSKKTCKIEYCMLILHYQSLRLINKGDKKMDTDLELFAAIDLIFDEFWYYEIDDVKFKHFNDREGNEVEVSLEVLRKDNDLMVVLVSIKKPEQMMTNEGCDIYVHESSYRVKIDSNQLKAYMLVSLHPMYDGPN